MQAGNVQNRASFDIEAGNSAARAGQNAQDIGCCAQASASLCLSLCGAMCGAVSGAASTVMASLITYGVGGGILDNRDETGDLAVLVTQAAVGGAIIGAACGALKGCLGVQQV